MTSIFLSYARGDDGDFAAMQVVRSGKKSAVGQRGIGDGEVVGVDAHELHARHFMAERHGYGVSAN